VAKRATGDHGGKAGDEKRVRVQADNVLTSVGRFELSRDLRGSLSSSSEALTPHPFPLMTDCNVLLPNSLVAPPGPEWLCGRLEIGAPLYVRECYSWFYDFALERKNVGSRGVIFTGTPGIGKSAWLNYALVRFLQDGFAVLLQRAGLDDFFVFRDGICTHGFTPTLSSTLLGLPSKAVYLFDPDETKTAPRESRVFTIAATSPQIVHYKWLRKIGCSMRYFPCWRLDELAEARPDVSAAVLLERFVKWGGIPRFVFGDQPSFEAQFRMALPSVDLSLVFKYVISPEISSEDQYSLSQMFVQYRVVGDDFATVELDFASGWIGQQLLSATAQREYQKLVMHYLEARRLEGLGTYCGHMWEYVCHAILPNGTEKGFKLEPLNLKSANRRILKEVVAVKKGKLEDAMPALEDGFFPALGRKFRGGGCDGVCRRHRVCISDDDRRESSAQSGALFSTARDVFCRGKEAQFRVGG
jgi:hypothetical protein